MFFHEGFRAVIVASGNQPEVESLFFNLVQSFYMQINGTIYSEINKKLISNLYPSRCLSDCWSPLSSSLKKGSS
jgi:hypothetical protein